MRNIPQDTYQNILLNIMKAFHQYCSDNGIKLLLCGGTTIGAVRHKGFIPWDDDVDLYIFRDGFNKLMSLAQKDPFIDEQRRYKILIPGKLPCVYPFFNIIDTKTVVYEKNIDKKYATGAWIDVFCLSYWANDIKVAKKQFKKQQFYKAMNKLIIGGNYRDDKYKKMECLAGPIRRIFLCLGMNSEYWCKKILALDKYTSGHHMGNICWPNSFEKEYYKSEWFAQSIEVNFADIVCQIPKDYDAVLRNFYGDYMTIPPAEKRVRHNPEAYFIDEE